MQRYADKRREIYVHSNATLDDLPLTGTYDLPPVSNSGAFIPDNMENPKLYPGDVIAGVAGGEVAFVELIVDKGEDMVIVVPLDKGLPTIVQDNIFSARIFRCDRVHVFEAIGDEIEAPDVEFDASKLDTPEEKRPR